MAGQSMQDAHGEMMEHMRNVRSAVRRAPRGSAVATLGTSTWVGAESATKAWAEMVATMAVCDYDADPTEVMDIGADYLTRVWAAASRCITKLQAMDARA